MNLIPKVKNLELCEGFLKKQTICFDENEMDSRLVTALKKLPCDSDGTKLEIAIIPEDIFTDGNADVAGDAYELCIGEEHIKIRTSSSVGAFYAIQTLRQLFKEEKPYSRSSLVRKN